MVTCQLVKGIEAGNGVKRSTLTQKVANLVNITF